MVEFMKYPKIHTLWKREPPRGKKKKKGKVIPGEFSREEFASVRRWSVSEKVDGMNIRVMFLDGKT